ncbi:hypothetical protein THIOKS13140002 [Thiocapsa sp. KS1]|nr:hypothetical protein THIOKS13140002 [Thiocapsa sp. KS1]
MMKEVTHEYQASLHLSEVADRFPAHGLVDVEQRALPALEPRVLHHFFTEALPRTLKIGQDGFLVEGRLSIESHSLGRSIADNPGSFRCSPAGRRYLQVATNRINTARNAANRLSSGPRPTDIASPSRTDPAGSGHRRALVQVGSIRELAQDELGHIRTAYKSSHQGGIGPAAIVAGARSVTEPAGTHDGPVQAARPDEALLLGLGRDDGLQHRVHSPLKIRADLRATVADPERGHGDEPKHAMGLHGLEDALRAARLDRLGTDSGAQNADHGIGSLNTTAGRLLIEHITGDERHPAACLDLGGVAHQRRHRMTGREGLIQNLPAGPAGGAKECDLHARMSLGNVVDRDAHRTRRPEA